MDNHGSHVPCMGAVALVRRFARCGIPGTGAMPCVGLIPLDDYLAELTEMKVAVTERTRIVVGAAEFDSKSGLERG